MFKEHQTQDWKRHKRLCSYLSTAAEEVGAETFFGREFRFVDTDDNNADDAEGLADVEKELEKLDLKVEDSKPETEKEETNLKKKEVESTEILEEEEDKAATWKTWCQCY
jgi:hypothetical protein